MFSQKAPSQMFDWVLNTPLTTSLTFPYNEQFRAPQVCLRLCMRSMMELFSVNTFAKSSMIDALQTLIYHRIFFLFLIMNNVHSIFILQVLTLCNRTIDTSSHFNPAAVGIQISSIFLEIKPAISGILEYHCFGSFKILERKRLPQQTRNQVRV